MDVIVLIGRILFAFLFLTSGYAHFAQRKMMAQFAGAKGVPMPMPAVLGGGVLLVAGGIMVLLGLWADLGALLLVIFLLPTAVLMHAFWKETDPQSRQMETVQFSKDIGAGRSLIDALRVLLVRWRRLGTDTYRPAVQHQLACAPVQGRGPSIPISVWKGPFLAPCLTRRRVFGRMT